MKIIIFGTGSYAESIINNINKDIEIVAASDNNQSKWWTSWNEIDIIPPYKLKEYEFNYILVASMYTKDILEKLLDIGVDIRKIICLYSQYEINSDHEIILRNIFKVEKTNKIALISYDNSGCNARALFKQIPEYIKEEFDIKLIEERSREEVANFGIHVSTHYNVSQNMGKINIDLWHGFPLKTMGIMNKIENNEKKFFYKSLSKNIDFSISYSNLYTYLLSSCSNINADKFKITGAPRNDLLINKSSKSILENVINKDLCDKTIIFYVPTFRKRISNNKTIIDDGVNLEEGCNEIIELNSYFEKNNIVLVIKKHAFTCDVWEINQNDNISFITNQMLSEYDIDFYEILGAADMLITDFSSVYYDYLLLDRPIIFFAKDYDEYRNNRGLLLEPYDFWTPGPKTHNSEQLKKEIELFLNHDDYYMKEREQIRNITHTYKDFNSRERVWKEIYDYIKSKE